MLDKFIIGQFCSAHGIRGNILLRSFTDKASDIFVLPLVDKDNNELKIKMVRQKSINSFVCSMDNIKDRNAAEKLKGEYLFCFQQNLPKLEENEFYIEELRNLPLLDKNLTAIGKVVDAMNFGAGDILEIELNIANNVTKKLMLSFKNEIFPEVNKEYIIIDLDYCIVNGLV